MVSEPDQAPLFEQKSWAREPGEAALAGPDAYPPEVIEAWRLKRMGPNAKRGYFAPPGTGPQPHTCGDCRHAHVRAAANRYWKCSRCREGWSSGPRSDVAKGAPACRGWEPLLPCACCGAPEEAGSSRGLDWLLERADEIVARGGQRPVRRCAACVKAGCMEHGRGAVHGRRQEGAQGTTSPVRGPLTSLARVIVLAAALALAAGACTGGVAVGGHIDLLSRPTPTPTPVPEVTPAPVRAQAIA